MSLYNLDLWRSQQISCLVTPRKLPILHLYDTSVYLILDLKCVPLYSYSNQWSATHVHLTLFRCVDAMAYEVKREDVSNGIFINFLKQRVCEDEKVTVMLDRVAEGMWSYTGPVQICTNWPISCLVF